MKIKIKKKKPMSVIIKTAQVKPELEDLEVTPSIEEQNFKSEKYGFDNVTVKKVTYEIDSNIKPEYIKLGTNILGVEGEYFGIDTNDATATASNILEGKTAYVNGEKIEGSIPNNGELNYTPTEETQIIPKGYTEGGIITPIESEELTITPSEEEQVNEGLFNKVTVAGDENLKAENIKKGVSIFDVLGTLEGGDNLKQFSSIEEMESSTGNVEGNLAVVYGEGYVDLEVGKTYTEMYLPQTIIFDSARTTTSNIFFSTGTVMTATHFVKITTSAIQFYKKSSLTGAVVNTVKYTSTDKQTYTRTDSLGEYLTIAEIYNNAYSSITVQSGNYNLLTQMFKTLGEKYFGSYIYSDGVWKLCQTDAENEKTELIEELSTNFISSIDDSLGANCTKLPDGLTSIATSAFEGCKNLALIELPDGIITIGNSAFSGCTNLALTKLPENLTTLGGYAFNGCINLALTKLPENLTAMESFVFNNCKKLAIKEIPAGITVIPKQAFTYCEGLTEVTCLGDVTQIDYGAFRYCTNLEKLVFPNVTTVPKMERSNTFEDTKIDGGTGYIYVPDNLVDSFKSASYWSSYKNQIKGISKM